MNYKIGRSASKDAQNAVSEACAGLQNPKFIFFSSGVKHFGEYTDILHQKYPQATIMGTTAYTSLCNEGSFHEDLLLIGFTDGVECAAGVLEEADRYPVRYVDRLEQAANKIGTAHGDDTVCFVAMSAFCSCEELVLSTLNSVLHKKKIPVFGGTAADNGSEMKSLLSLNGVIYEKACVFAILRFAGTHIHFYRENIYRPINNKHVTVTKADPTTRTAFEFDGRPAAVVEAEAFGTTVSGLPSIMDSHPLGRIIGNDVYILANASVGNDQKSMQYHARVYDNSQIVFMEPDDYKSVIAETCKKIKQDVPKPKLAIMIHCIARSMHFESMNYLNTYAKEMGNVLGAYIGFSGYGEQLRDQQFNQTMTLAVFE